MKTIYVIGMALFPAVIFLLVVTAAPVYGQTVACAPVITVLDEAIANCNELNTNWACYAHTTNLVAPDQIRFSRPKDRQPIEIIEEISTEFRDGATILRLQLESEFDPVTAILFGAARLQPEQQPPTAHTFLLHYANNEYLCEATPSGLVVRTEAGKRGRITLNQVDIELGSTAFVWLGSANQMEVINITGDITVSVDALGVSRQLAVGEAVGITLENNLPVTVTLPISSIISTSPVIQWLATNEDGLPAVTDSNTISNPVTPACGGAIAYDQPVMGEHHAPGQECLFTFAGASGDVVTIHFDALDDALDPWVDLRDPAKQLISTNNDIDQAEINSLICNHPLTADGIYTIVARPHHNESIGRFRLTLKRSTDCRAPLDQGEAAAVAVPVCRPARPGGWVNYTVNRGDTLSGLAAKTGTSVARLQQVNCLSSTLIRIGQLLYVPSPPCQGLVIAAFAVAPGPTSATVRWRAVGGCAPLAGTLAVRYSNGSSARFGVAGAGALNLASPAGDTCPLSATYSLSMRDQSGLGASVVQSATLRASCPKESPFGAP